MGKTVCDIPIYRHGEVVVWSSKKLKQGKIRCADRNGKFIFAQDIAAEDISLPNPPITQEDRFAPNREIGEPRNFVDGHRAIRRFGILKQGRMPLDVAKCSGIVFECFELVAIGCRVRKISGNDIVALISLCFLLSEDGGDSTGEKVCCSPIVFVIDPFAMIGTFQKEFLELFF